MQIPQCKMPSLQPSPGVPGEGERGQNERLLGLALRTRYTHGLRRSVNSSLFNDSGITMSSRFLLLAALGVLLCLPADGPARAADDTQPIRLTLRSREKVAGVASP